MAIKELNEIQNEIVTNILSIAPNVDVIKGPIYDLIIRPISNVAKDFYIEADRIRKLSSTDYYKEMTLAELQNLAYVNGILTFPGARATGTVEFFVNNVNTTLFTIPIGTTVATVEENDFAYAFQTIEDISIHSTLLKQYYNPEKRTYVIPVKVEAVNVGEEYNIAAYNITEVLANIYGVSGVQNSTPMTGGRSEEDIDSLALRISESSLIGDRGTIPGIRENILKSYPQVNDLKMIKTVESIEPFRTFKSAIDAFVIGSTPAFSTDLHDATITENGQVFKFKKNPVLEVLSVSVNDEILNNTEYSLQNNVGWDFDLGYYDTLQVKSLVKEGSIVSVTYNYDDLIYSMNSEYKQEQNDLFGISMVFRPAVKVNVGLKVVRTLQNSTNEISSATLITSLVQRYINSNSFRKQLSTVEVANYLKENLTGFYSINVEYIYRTDTIYDRYYGVVEFKDYEYPFISIDDIIIS